MTKPPEQRTYRCAIYTRKSSEEGLEQSFNSLHAQREACEAYIKSQAHEGWTCLAQDYDDGGFSGGNMDRPALKRLLDDIARGRVDIVVVYKVDRLTRSLHDFAKIVDTFDAAKASFVSITQSFNTTTSMGRLTLNMLLSFAQYEREVTGERIRDKIAASKAKGMWMGGNLPLGYDAGDHTLVINPAEAEQVRHIFARYLALGSVERLQGELERQGYRSKAWITKKGAMVGGNIVARGALYHLLRNRHYRGEIQHKELVHPGRHPPIVDAEIFEAVQQRLETERVRRPGQKSGAPTARLKGRIFVTSGEPMVPSHAYGRHGKLHRYYVCVGGVAEGSDDEGPPKRIAAEALEGFVHDVLRRLSDRPEASWEELHGALHRLEVRAGEAHLSFKAAPLLNGEPLVLGLETFRGRLTPAEQLVVEVKAEGILRLVLPLRLCFRGGRTWLTDEDGRATRRVRRQDRSLAIALKTAHAIHRRHGADLNDPAHWLIDGAPTNPYQRKVCELALLAPDLQRQILDGRQPAQLTLARLLESEVPIAWADQRAWFEGLAS